MSFTVFFTTLSAFVWSGLNPPRMTDVHWVKRSVLVLFRAWFHYISVSYFNLHNWNFSLWGALSVMAT